MATLSRQKADLVETQRVEDMTRARRQSMAASAPSLSIRPQQQQQPPQRRREDSVQQVASTMHGSAAYSFGRPRHRRGKFGLQVLEPRDMDYVPPTGGVVVPGAGAHNIPHTDGHDLEATEGHTGGWSWRQHSLFMQTLEEYEGVASPEFFDRLAFKLPGVPRKAFTDHLRWLADFELSAARKQRRVTTWVLESKGKDAPEDRKEQFMEWKRAREFNRQAEEEDVRSGLRDRKIVFKPVQCGHGEVLLDNMRGHPQLRKAPGYTFGVSREIRDVREKRRTGLSHVRSTSALDAPGPGAYCGLAEKAPLLEQKPSYSMGKALPAQKVRHASVEGPGYSGPLHAWDQVQKELAVKQSSNPAWAVSKAHQRCEDCSNERKSLRDLTSTGPEIGPGYYRHATSFVTQRPV